MARRKSNKKVKQMICSAALSSFKSADYARWVYYSSIKGPHFGEVRIGSYEDDEDCPLLITEISLTADQLK